jgi:hypothetical protein
MNFPALYACRSAIHPRSLLAGATANTPRRFFKHPRLFIAVSLSIVRAPRVNPCANAHVRSSKINQRDEWGVYSFSDMLDVHRERLTEAAGKLHAGGLATRGRRKRDRRRNSCPTGAGSPSQPGGSAHAPLRSRYRQGASTTHCLTPHPTLTLSATLQSGAASALSSRQFLRLTTPWPEEEPQDQAQNRQ